MENSFRTIKREYGDSVQCNMLCIPKGDANKMHFLVFYFPYSVTQNDFLYDVITLPYICDTHIGQK